jgi:flavin-dependent dehydrogenase
VLFDLGVAVPPGRDVGDILVVGPNGHRVRLPSGQGLTYPGYGRAVTRTILDRALHDAALAAGAVPVRGRADEPLWNGGRIEGFRLTDGSELRSDFVIGADGATSQVARSAGLVDPRKVLWGFAVRAYLPDAVALPAIVFWEPTKWHAFPGYGWVFPGAEGGANVGLGLATLSDRTAAAAATRALPAFFDHLRRLELVARRPAAGSSRQLGGWLKMGIVGTTPAAGGVLLVGDAAGLVNPLQGEGIAQAMGSSRLAAEAILARAGQAAAFYRGSLAAQHLPYHRLAAALQKATVARPRAMAVMARLLVSAGRLELIAGGWSVFWNELLDGAPKNDHAAVARAMTYVGRVATSRGSTAQWFGESLGGAGVTTTSGASVPPPLEPQRKASA